MLVFDFLFGKRGNCFPLFANLSRSSIFFIFLLLNLFTSLVFAADRYWVGGGSSANWSATGPTNWGSASNTQDNASVPTSSDDVYFDGVGTGASNSTLSASITVRSLNMTGYANTLTHNSAVTLSIGDGTAGAGNIALKLVAGMTYTLGNGTTSAISFITTSATQQTVTWGGKTAGNVTFNATSNGDWAITDAMTIGSSATMTLTAGTLHADGAADNSGLTHSWGIFTGSGGTLTLGTCTLNITNSATNVVWNMSSSTLTANTATINLTGSGSHTFNSGSKTTYHTVSFASGHNPLMNSSSTYVNLSKVTTTNTDFIGMIANSTSITVTGTFTIQGSSDANRLLVNSQTLGSQRTWVLTGATVSAQYVDFRDTLFSVATDLSAITGGSGDCGGNSGITFTTAQTNYWVGGTGNWSDSNEWASSSGGAGGSGRVPLPQDDATFDANSFSGASQTVTANMPRLGKSINWTGATNSPTFAINSMSNTIYGSLTLISAMTLTSNQTFVFDGRGSFTLTSAGKSFGGSITVAGVGGTITLQDDFTTTNTMNHTFGTFNANNFNVTCSNYATSDNSNTRTLTMGSGTWTMTGVSASSTAFYINSVSNFTLSSSSANIVLSDTSASTKDLYFKSGATYASVSITGGGSGAYRFMSQFTLGAFTINAPKTVHFASGNTYSLSSFTANGSSGSTITLQAITSGSAATLSDTAGENTVKFCSIKDITASGGALWTAKKSTNTSGNTGWRFQKPTIVVH